MGYRFRCHRSHAHSSYQFNNQNPCLSNRKIVTVDGSLTIVIGVGDIQISPILTLRNVLHVFTLYFLVFDSLQFCFSLVGGFLILLLYFLFLNISLCRFLSKKRKKRNVLHVSKLYTNLVSIQKLKPYSLCISRLAYGENDWTC